MSPTTEIRGLEIAALEEVGETFEQVARWLNEEWGAFHEASLEDTRDWLRSVLDRRPDECILVAYVDGHAVGVAMLVACDLPERSELAPWLTSLYVLPKWRGRTIGRRLAGAVTLLARRHGHERLYLYTETPRIYERLGWRHHERLHIEGQEFYLMKVTIPARTAFLEAQGLE